MLRCFEVTEGEQPDGHHHGSWPRVEVCVLLGGAHPGNHSHLKAGPFHEWALVAYTAAYIQLTVDEYYHMATSMAS